MKRNCKWGKRRQRNVICFFSGLLWIFHVVNLHTHIYKCTLLTRVFLILKSWSVFFTPSLNPSFHSFLKFIHREKNLVPMTFTCAESDPKIAWIPIFRLAPISRKIGVFPFFESLITNLKSDFWSILAFNFSPNKNWLFVG